jgi:hypothetical protein
VSYDTILVTLGAAHNVAFKLLSTPAGIFYQPDGTTQIAQNSPGAFAFTNVAQAGLRFKASTHGTNTLKLIPTGGTDCTSPGTSACQFVGTGYDLTAEVSEPVYFKTNFQLTTLIKQQASPAVSVTMNWKYPDTILFSISVITGTATASDEWIIFEANNPTAKFKASPPPPFSSSPPIPLRPSSPPSPPRSQPQSQGW